MMHLPYDIWLQVTSHLSGLEIQRLYAVNSALFNIAMDERYRQVSLAYLGNKMVRTLARLRDPVVARRVRILYIHPHFLSALPSRDPVPTTPKFLKLFSPKKPSRKVDDIEQLIQSIPSILSSLPNLTEYHISWNGLENVSKDSVVPFLAAPFVNGRLKKVWLDISLDHLGALLPHTPSFGRVQELDLFLRDELQDQSVLRSLAERISSISGTLRTLSIRLFSPIDLTPLFDHLNLLPKLTNVKLDIPIESPHLGCPISLSKFLNTNSQSIQHLSIRASQLNVTATQTECLEEWLTCLIQLLHLDKLTTLEISSGYIPFDKILLFLGQFAKTLTRLSVTGSNISQSQLSSILSTLSYSSIKTLKLGSLTLFPTTIPSILTSLTNLRKLDVLVRDTLPYENSTPIYMSGHGHRVIGGGGDEQYQEVSQLDEFFLLLGDEAATQPYSKLDCLTLTRTSRPFRFEYPDRYLETFRMLLGGKARVEVVGS